jgi:hypothetical protein
MTEVRTPTVWLVSYDRRRDYSAADAYGDVRHVFSSIGREFNGRAAIEHARTVLRAMHPDDYLVMAGDPALCAICVTVAAELLGTCLLLRWDKNKLSYSELRLNF